MSNDLEYSLGLDVRTFEAQAAKVVHEVHGIHRAFRTLHQLFVLGGIVTAFKHFFDSAIEYAKNYQGATDDNIEATKRFGETMEASSHTVAQWGVTFIGWIEKGAIGLSSLVYGVEAASDAYDQMGAEAKKALDVKATAELTAATEKYAKILRDIAYEQGSLQQRRVILFNEIVDLDGKIADAGKDEIKRMELQGELAKKEAEMKKINTAIDETDAKAGAAKAAAAANHLATIKEQIIAARVLAHEGQLQAEQEQKIYEIALKQLEAKQELDALEAHRLMVAESTLIVNGKAYGQSRDPRTLSQASDAELKELIRRSILEINSVDQAKGHGLSAVADAASGFIIQGSVIDRLRTDIMRAQFQLDQRAALRSPGSRQAFQGDPLEYDRLYQAAQGTDNKQTELLTQIKDALVTRGIRTLPLGSGG